MLPGGLAEMQIDFGPRYRLKTPQDCAAYSEALIAGAGEDAGLVVKALGEVTKSQGMSAVAPDAGSLARACTSQLAMKATQALRR